MDFDFEVPKNKPNGPIPPRRPLPKKEDANNQQPVEEEEVNPKQKQFEIEEDEVSNESENQVVWGEKKKDNNEPPNDLFSDFDSESGNNKSKQNQQNGQNDEEQQGRYSTPKVEVNKSVMTVAGVIGAVLLLFLLGSFGINKFNNYREDRENKIRLNNTGVQTPGGVYVFNEDSEDKVSSSVSSQSLGTKGDSKTSVISEIAKYNKFIAEDGRTCIKVSLDDYGDYVIFIPNINYETLENKGYIIVDLELVGNKITYIYVSKKQENFEKMLGN